MVNRIIALAGTGLAVFILFSATAFAGNSQASFSISPAPIATPVFDVKETDMKIGLTYLNIKSTDPGVDFKLDGYGLNATGRSSFGNMLAIDYAIGVMYLTGDIQTALTGTSSFKADISGPTIPISFNLEVQPYKNDVFNAIIFVGPAFSLSEMTVKTSGVMSSTAYIYSYMYGVQGGLQLGLKMGDFHLDAFGMTSSMQGSQTVSTDYGDTDSTIPAYTTTSFGADLMYIPWGLTLSSLLQEAKQSDNNGFKTTMYQLSWSHKF